MSENEVTAEVAAIQRRLAALAAHPARPGIAQELGMIRAQLRELAARNEQVASPLEGMLRSPPAGHD